jgi:hypothetical protein
MIVSARAHPGASFDALIQILQCLTHALSPPHPVHQMAEEMLRDMIYMQFDTVEYSHDDAVVIVASRATERLVTLQKNEEPDIDVIKFLRSFIEAAMQRILPAAEIREVYHYIQAACNEESPPPTGLEGFAYGVVMVTIYGDIRKLSILCSIDELREVILAHIDIISARTEVTLPQKKEVIHAFACCLGVIH